MSSVVSLGLREQDRRGHRRRIAIVAAKVYDERAERYFAAETTNVSASGCLLRINRTMPLNRGDRLAVGLAAQPATTWMSGRPGAVPSQPVLRKAGLEAATVVRVTPIDPHTQVVAVHFDRVRQEDNSTCAAPGVEFALNAVVNVPRPGTASVRPAAAA